VAAGLFCLFAVYSFDWGGMRTQFVSAALLFVLAGFLRGNSFPPHGGLKALLLISAFLIFLGLIRPNPSFKLVILAVIAYGSSLAAVYARRSWAVGAQNRSLFILGATLAVVEIASVLGAPVLAKWLTTRTANVPASEVSVMRLDGRRVDSAQLRGRITVLCFWATWCPPCWQEFPQLERLYERYESNPDVVFLAIDAKGKGETPELARAFIENGGYTIPAAFDDQRAAARLHVRVYPSLLILDRSWHVRLVHAGYDGSERHVENLSNEIDRLLAE